MEKPGLHRLSCRNRESVKLAKRQGAVERQAGLTCPRQGETVLRIRLSLPV